MEEFPVLSTYGGIVLASEADLYPSNKPLGLLQVPRSSNNFTICYGKPNPILAAKIAQKLDRKDSLEWATVRAGPMDRRSAYTFSLAQSMLALFGLPSIKNIIIRLIPDIVRELQCAALPEYGHGVTSCTRRDYKRNLDHFVLMECIHTSVAGFTFDESLPMTPYVNPRKPMESRRKGCKTWEGIQTLVLHHQSLASNVPVFKYTNSNMYPYTMVKSIIARYVLGLTNVEEENFVVVRRPQTALATTAAPTQATRTPGPLQFYDIYNTGTYSFYRNDAKCITHQMGGMRQFNAVFKAWLVYFNHLLADMNQWLAIVRSSEFEKLGRANQWIGGGVGYHASWDLFKASVEERLVYLIASPDSFKQLVGRVHDPTMSRMHEPQIVISKQLDTLPPKEVPEPPPAYTAREQSAQLATRIKIAVIIEEKARAAATAAAVVTKEPKPMANGKKRARCLPIVDQEVYLPQSKRICLRTIDEVEGFDGTVWVLPLFPQMSLQPLLIPVYINT